MYWFNKVVRRLRRPRLAPPSAAEEALIDALRARIRALPAIRGGTDGTSADSPWLQNRARLRSELLSKDPRTLVGFPVIRETMFVDHPPYIGHELRAQIGRASCRERVC